MRPCDTNARITNAGAAQGQYEYTHDQSIISGRLAWAAAQLLMLVPVLMHVTVCLASAAGVFLPCALFYNTGTGHNCATSSLVALATLH